MPVPSNMFNKNEKVIKIQREGNTSLQPSTAFPGNSLSQQQNQAQQETRSWSQSSYKKVVQSSDAPEPVVTQHSTSTKSSDLFSNKHGGTTSPVDRRGSNSSTTSSTNNNLNNTSGSKTTSQMKSSSLVSKALQEFEDDVQNLTKNQQSFHEKNNTSSSSRRNSSNTTTSKTAMMTMPVTTPTMEIVPSGGGMSPGWSMGTDAQGDVPLTYEIVTRADGKKEFQLLVTTKDFSPEDLQVKLTDNTLTISGNHEERSPSGAFSSKSFYRTCTIPSGVNPQDLNCSLDTSGRLKITAPVPDIDHASKHSSTTKKMITSTSSKQQQNLNNLWHEDGNVPSGFKISPGEKEQVMTVFNNNSNSNNDLVEDFGNGVNLNVDNNGFSTTTKKSVSSTTKTVKTFKTMA